MRRCLGSFPHRTGSETARIDRLIANEEGVGAGLGLIGGDHDLRFRSHKCTGDRMVRAREIGEEDRETVGRVAGRIRAAEFQGGDETGCESFAGAG